MGQVSRTQKQADSESQPARSALTVASEASQPSTSPARQLREQLEAAYVHPRLASDGEKWSKRSSILFVVGVSAALWAGLIGFAVLIAHAISH
jgi:hypothetical protein